MERPIVWAAETPADTDFLRGFKAAMVALGWLQQEIVGTGTVCTDLPCTPGTGLNVSVGLGAIYAQEQTDATAYGSFAVDTTLLMKQGLNLAPVTLACPAPTTPGQSVYYLVEAQYQDLDTGSTVLPFYNTANPSQWFNGVGGGNTPNYTIRRGVCALQIKAGTAAATGSQTVPAPDAGWVGLWAIDVANGSTTISSGQITAYSGSPLITEKLNAKISTATATALIDSLFPGLLAAQAPPLIQSGAYNAAIDSGTANNIAIALSPEPAALTTGLRVSVKVAATNTSGTVEITVGAGSPEPVIYKGANPPIGGIVGAQWYDFQYDATVPAWVLMTPLSAADFTSNQQPISTTLIRVAHGIGVKPSRTEATMICLTAELGYTPGEEIDLPATTYTGAGGGTSSQMAVFGDPTYANLSLSATSTISIPSGGGGGGGGYATAGNWAVIFRCWR